MSLPRFFVFLVFSCLLVFAITIFFRLGGHKEVTISEDPNPPQLVLLGAPHTGAYHKIVGVIEQVETWAREHHLPCTRSFGEYIDDPKTQDEARLRSIGGCVLDGVQSVTLSDPLPEGFTVRPTPKRPVVTATFTGAPSIGPFKVYPKVEKYLEEKALVMDGPVIEIYSTPAQDEALTEYRFTFRAKDSRPSPP
jgi:AraC family transcriptional regulator